MCRKVDYMRISVTDRCNLRCSYCMPKEGLPLFAHDEILTFEEIVRLSKIFTHLGGTKIRLTGGEPLVRRGLIDLIKQLKEIEGLEKLCLTTNGIFLPKFANELKNAGLDQINISLDSLDKDQFKKITNEDNLEQVLSGIDKINEAGFKNTKINTVILKGINDNEIYDFIDFALKNNLTLRFIEFMKVTPLWKSRHYLPVCSIKEICEKRYELEKINCEDASPAEYYKINENRIGFIQTARKNCDQCNRLRITPIGKLKVCLYEESGIDLSNLLRGGYGDQVIGDIMRSKMEMKEDVNYTKWKENNIFMSCVGG